MISIRFVKLYSILLVCLCSGLSVWAQQNIPDRPFIDKVSVDPQTGDVTIIWNMPVPQVSQLDVDYFVLYWGIRYKVWDPVFNEFREKTKFFAFDSIQYSVQEQWSYTFEYKTIGLIHPDMPDPRETSVPFGIGAVHETPYSPSIISVPHDNIQVNNEYDPCRAEIKLKWHPYKTWQTNTLPNEPLVSYHVMRILNDGVHEEIKVLAESDTFHVVPRVNENDWYTFYIKAKRRDGAETFSYQTEKYTEMPIQPSFITAERTQYNSDGLAEISFKLDPLGETYSYEFYGSSNPEYSFVSLGAFDIYDDNTILTDIQKREKTYYYKLEAWHTCNNKISAASNTATALWLSHKQLDQVNLLFWDPYQDWGGDVQYELHRQIDVHPDEVITIITDPDATVYNDDLTSVFIDGDICYWVTATPVSPKSSSERAESNSVCIKPESDIFIPQAFTPKDPGPDPNAPNDKFKPFFSYEPQEYTLLLYDRTGAKVFETKDTTVGWDGTLMNGKPASEGVYVYYITYRTAIGRMIEKKGKFVLLLP